MRMARMTITTTIGKDNDDNNNEVEDEDKGDSTAYQPPLQGGQLAGCNDDWRRKREEEGKTRMTTTMTGWGGGCSACPYTSGITWQKRGAPLGDDDNRDNANAVAFAGKAKTMTTISTRRRRRERRVKHWRDSTDGTLTTTEEPLRLPPWRNRRRQRLRRQSSGGL